MSDPLAAHQWTPQPVAAEAIAELVALAMAGNAWLADFAQRLRTETGTRLGDWVDHLAVVRDAAGEVRLRASGFVTDAVGLRHPGGLFPRVVWSDRPGLALKVEAVADLLAANGIEAEIAGAPGPGVRRALVATGDADVWAIERLGGSGIEATTAPPALAVAALRHGERFRCRRRAFADPAAGFAHARGLIDAAAAELGRDAACALFFTAERAFWQRRNHAARVQRARQDALGLGWGNHDHHTYRSSRAWFAPMIAVFEALGFTCRERFYAGAEAGWGAQVLEQAATGIVIFADVDLSPDELREDFAHAFLPPRDRLGTVGLWCALHGEAFLEAGMHHLEATFAFDEARAQLAALGVATMKPFTDYPYLRQCFTAGQRWPVAPGRIDRLHAEGMITSEQAAVFRRDGALGAHLEILERNDGFKGFNQHGVSEIIAATDPRHAG